MPLGREERARNQQGCDGPANFFADNVNSLLIATGIQPVAIPRVLLPIGISFFTFHAISYVVDVYRRDAVAQKSPIHAALYLLLFPQLIAGPIIRYREIATQLAHRSITIADFGDGIKILKGRYGPYITDGKKNAKIPKDTEPDSITHEQAKTLLTEAPTKKPFKRTVRRKSS